MGTRSRIFRQSNPAERSDKGDLPRRSFFNKSRKFSQPPTVAPRHIHVPLTPQLAAIMDLKDRLAIRTVRSKQTAAAHDRERIGKASANDRLPIRTNSIDKLRNGTSFGSGDTDELMAQASHPLTTRMAPDADSFGRVVIVTECGRFFGAFIEEAWACVLKGVRRGRLRGGSCGRLRCYGRCCEGIR